MKSQLDVVKLAKMRLGITSNVRDDFLTHLVLACEDEIKNKGVYVDYEENDVLSFMVDYTCFKYKNNDFKGIPLYLRYALNNLIVRGS